MRERVRAGSIEEGVFRRKKEEPKNEQRPNQTWGGEKSIELLYDWGWGILSKTQSLSNTLLHESHSNNRVDDGTTTTNNRKRREKGGVVEGW